MVPVLAEYIWQQWSHRVSSLRFVVCLDARGNRHKMHRHIISEMWLVVVGNVLAVAQDQHLIFAYIKPHTWWPAPVMVVQSGTTVSWRYTFILARRCRCHVASSFLCYRTYPLDYESTEDTCVFQSRSKSVVGRLCSSTSKKKISIKCSKLYRWDRVVHAYICDIMERMVCVQQL